MGDDTIQMLYILIAALERITLHSVPLHTSKLMHTFFSLPVHVCGFYSERKVMPLSYRKRECLVAFACEEKNKLKNEKKEEEEKSFFFVKGVARCSIPWYTFIFSGMEWNVHTTILLLLPIMILFLYSALIFLSSIKRMNHSASINI